MKNILSAIILLSWFLFMLSGCSDMNDKHDLYLADGERVYIGKIDSLKVFPGKHRVKLRFWASDPRCKSVGFFWVPSNDSVLVNIDKSTLIDSFEVIIGGENSSKILNEGSYTFKAITFDEMGNHSVPFEETL